MSVIGVDPGISGAMTHYGNGRVYEIVDMPIFKMVINKKERKRLDMVSLYQYFEVKRAMGVELVTLEAVGGRPAQSASAAFVFGYTVGAIFAVCVALRLPIETVSPAIWKREMRIPGKKTKEGKLDKGYEGKIISRADEIMPQHSNLWRGPSGGRKIDRAESALIAKYGYDHLLRIPGVRSKWQQAETQLVYQNAETGA